MSKLQQLESLIDPSDFYRRGVNLWPLYRFFITEGLRDRRLGTSSANPIKKSLYSQCLEFVKGVLSTVSILLKTDKVDAVFLSHSNFQRFTLDGFRFDPYCYPVVAELKSRGMRSVVYQVGQRENCNESYIKTVNIESAFNSWSFILAPLATIDMRLRVVFSNEISLSNKVNFALDSINIDLQVPDDKFFMERAARLRAKALFFRFLLKRHSPSFGLMVGYGSGPGLAYTYACSLEKIRSIELQHGMVSPGLPRYAAWSKVPEQGYQLLPDIFWCWEKAEISEVYKWTESVTSHNVFSAGNLYLRYRQNYSSVEGVELKKRLQASEQPYDHRCLVALQSQAVEPVWLMDAIIACRDSTLWLFKFHPADHDKGDRVKYIEHCFRKHGKSNYDLTSANNAALNIYDCIDAVDSVVSSFSSSLVEAMMLHKTPIIIHPEGEVHFQNYIDKGSMLLKSEKQDFVDYFDMPRKAGSTTSRQPDSENIEKIIDKIFTRTTN
jgi:hypothetical protein